MPAASFAASAGRSTSSALISSATSFCVMRCRSLISLIRLMLICRSPFAGSDGVGGIVAAASPAPPFGPTSPLRAPFGQPHSRLSRGALG